MKPNQKVVRTETIDSNISKSSQANAQYKWCLRDYGVG